VSQLESFIAIWSLYLTQNREVAFNFDHNQITGSVPTEIGAMKNLEYASMLNNTLNGPIPSEIARLGELSK
jgi:hypothetical protein